MCVCARRVFRSEEEEELDGWFWLLGYCLVRRCCWVFDYLGSLLWRVHWSAVRCLSVWALLCGLQNYFLFPLEGSIVGWYLLSFGVVGVGLLYLGGRSFDVGVLLSEKCLNKRSSC